MTDPRWTVITGASSGIGLEMARLAARRGRSLVLTARRTDRLDALAGELRGGDVRVETVTMDLQRPDGAEALLRAVEERGITVDTLVNNAGFGLRGGFRTMPYDEQIAMVELNCTTLTRLCRLVLPGLVERRRGGIINLSSMAAFQAVPFMSAYAATKAYVLLLSEGMHEEVRRHGVTVTAVCPGPTATEFRLRANLEKSKLFQGGGMSAVDVARLGLDGYEAGRAVVIPGAGNRALSVLSKVVP
ncbi:SDR family oxidoreductase, partial [Enterovirga sp.]|uniref:SDR family NAD(P)-dependent oxidoreductase n=1 Tax=Enterovirga sp. TaxID=2026350 RepID=UPI00263889EF